MSVTNASYDVDGFRRVPDAVDEKHIRAALRLIGLETRRLGLSAEEIADCQASTFFPHLRESAEIQRLLPRDLVEEEPGDEWCEPQILIRLPDPDLEWPLEPHRDVEPPWAAGRKYKAIVGLSLTHCSSKGGALAVWRGSHRGADRGIPDLLDSRAGDAIVMHPDLGHAGSLNLSHVPRIAIYFRLLGA